MTIEQISMTTLSALIVGGITLTAAVKWGGDRPVRRFAEFITSLVNLALGRPVYLVVLWYRGQEEWKEIFHCREYVAALAQRRERELTVACSLPL